MLYKIFRIIFVFALIIILLKSYAYLQMKSFQRHIEYSNCIYLIKIYKEYSSTGFLKHENGYVRNAFIYNNPIMVYGTNFFPVIGIRFFINNNDNDSVIYLINNREDIIKIDKDWNIKFLNFKY